MEEFSDSSAALNEAAALTLALGAAGVMPLRPKDEPLLSSMHAFEFGLGRRGWQIGDGPVVLLVHGYSGRAVQVAELAHAIARTGFRAVIFDAGGHGASRPEKVGFFTFMNDTRDIFAYLREPVFAMIGHSAGGLAMMRARRLFGVCAERYVVISAPFYPYVPLEGMRQRGASKEARFLVKAVLADQFQSTWPSMVGGESYEPDPGKPLLAIYDKADDRVRHADAERIAEVWPDTTVVKTLDYGHNRVLQAPETIQAVLDFLQRKGSERS